MWFTSAHWAYNMDMKYLIPSVADLVPNFFIFGHHNTYYFLNFYPQVF